MISTRPLFILALSRFKNENVACKATRFKTHGYTMVFGIGGRQYGKIKKIQKAFKIGKNGKAAGHVSDRDLFPDGTYDR